MKMYFKKAVQERDFTSGRLALLPFTPTEIKTNSQH